MKLFKSKKLILLCFLVFAALFLQPPLNNDHYTNYKKLDNTISKKEKLKRLELLPPPTSGQLLIDVNVNNTTPSAGDVITYKFRYRYASTTEHGSNAQIQMTFPDAYSIVSEALIGGNISNVSNSGNQYTLDLASPASLGIGAGQLAAGSSGIFEFKAQFDCGTNGSGGMPAAGSTVNFTQNPVFTVTGVSNTASAPSAVTVPTVSACAVPTSSGSGNFHKYSEDVVGLGMYHFFGISIPENTTTNYTYTDIFPAGFKLWDGVHCCSNFSTGWTVEVQANGTWWDITGLQTVAGFIDNVANGAVLKDQNGTNITGTMRVNATVTNGDTYSDQITNYAEGVTGLRMTGSGAHDDFFFYFYIPQTTPVGWYQNCLTTTNPAFSTDCQEVYVTDKGSLTLGCWFQDVPEGLGTTNLSSANNSFVVGNYPNLYKDPMDIQGVLSGSHRIKTTSVEAPTYEVLLPDGFDFIEGTTQPNYWVIEDQNITNNPASALVPVFTKIENYDLTGRTLLRWDFPNLTFPAFGPHYINDSRVDLKVYFSTRYMGTVALGTQVIANSTLKTKSVMTWTFGGAGYTGTPTQEIGCTMYYGPPTNGGSVNSEKYVKGALDTKKSRFPITGNTNVSGDASYEMYVYNHNFEKLKQIDIADILPYIGDKDMLGITNRGSGWSEELANAVTVERYRIGSGLVDASSKIPSGVLYSNTYNACYLDGALPAGQLTAVPSSASTGQSAGCTDFSNSVPASGAKGFAFQWLDVAEPLEFGEYLKITVNVNQLTGEADKTNNEVAWNSFAYTVVEEDNDVLFSSEPLKVGVKMVDLTNAIALGGRVWEDANGDGEQNAGEASFSSVTAYLYDASGNLVTESITISGVTSNVPVTALTDIDGNYIFYGLLANTTYSVRLENESNFDVSGSLNNYTLTSVNHPGVSDELDSDATEGTLSGSSATARPQIITATTGSGTTLIYNDFGFYKLGSVGNYVWLDDDAEGDQDGSEAAIQGVTMTLKDGITNTTVDTDITDANGLYIFENLPPGNYYIVASTLPAGKTVTGKQITGNSDNDSDFNTGSSIETDVFTMGSGEIRGDIDLGLTDQVLNPAAICGTTWDDFDEDGAIDGGEPKQQRVTINLLDASGFVIGSTISDDNGDYCFNNLEPNITYQVAFLLPSTTGSSYTNAGTNMEANSTTGVTLITYTPTNNQTINDVDCGFIGPFSIGNLVWSDVNDNGIRENGESAYSNVTLHLYTSSLSTLLATTTTDAYGKYVFTNLSQGTYKVALELPSSAGSSVDVGSTNSPNNADNDDNGIGTNSTGLVYSDVITLEMGGGANTGANWLETDHGELINRVYDPASNPKAYYTMDFGLVPLSQCSVGLDSDNDGISDICDDDDDNDGILDVVECAATTSGLTGPLTTFSTSITSSSSATDGFATHTLNSITYNGVVYTDLILPDLYTPVFSLTSPTNVGLRENGNIIYNSGSATYATDILQDAFRSRNLNAYQQLDGNDFTNGDHYILNYTNPVISTAGGFIAATERLGNNEQIIEALDINGNTIGTITIATSDYVDLGVNVYGSGAQNANMGLYPIDDLAPVGSEIYGLKISFGSSVTATGDGPDSKVFFIGDVSTIACDYDGDGIPNDLDLDSDNDGCPDAIEGGGNLTITNLDNNDRLTGVVDPNGIPSVAGSGQTMGSSQDASVIVCCDANASGNLDTDNDGISDICDDDDDNDGILDVVECPTPTNSGLTGPLTTFTTDISTTNASSNAVPHTLNSITYNGTTYTDFIVPDSYTPGFTLNDNTGVRFVKEGAFLFSIGSNANYNTDILPAFQSRNLNAYQDLDLNDFSDGDYFDLKYNTPVVSTAGGFIAVTERGGNNPQVIQALDINGNVIGTTVNVSTSDYVDLGVRVDPSGGQNANLALFPIDDLAAVGTYIHGIRLSFGTSSGAASDGPDAKAFLFGDVALLSCDYDGDGIPNHLDPDSDNDGCSDALEGAANITSANIVADRIGGTIDANGVPALASGGQGLGASQDENTSLGCNEICNDNMDNDGDGLIDCADSDCAPDVVSVAVTQPTCSNKTGGQIVITGSGSGTLTYSVNNSPTYQVNNTFTNLGVGQYMIRVKNDAGCVGEYTSNSVILDIGTCTEICNDGIDNDGDGLIDCDDPDCDDVGSATGINN